MPRLTVVAFVAALCAASLAAPAALVAQTAPAASGPTASTDSSAVADYARVHLALNALRDKEQVELAEPKNKKVDTQAEVRDRYRTRRAELYKAQQYTAAAYQQMTQRISGDDALRKMFDAALERLTKR